MNFVLFIRSLSDKCSSTGENFMNTGFTMEGFPSFGAWVTYEFGSDCNTSIRCYNDPRGMARSGKIILQCFLPASFQGF